MARLEILAGDCRAVLPTLEAGSVQCCVTSPPYWGLRDYGTAQWEGGDEGCEHSRFLGGNGVASSKQVSNNGTQKYQYRDECGHCGARRIDSQLGLEATPQEYIANMVAVFREVGRVLRDDGTLFLNLGDSYFSGSQRVASCDTSGKEPASSQANDYLSENLCDGCRAAGQSRKSRNDSWHDPKQFVLPFEPSHAHKELVNGHVPTSHSSLQVGHNSVAIDGSVNGQVREFEQPHGAQESNMLGSYSQSLDVCSQISSQDGVSPLSESSLAQRAQESCDNSGGFSQKQNYTENNVLLSEERQRRNRYIGAYCSKCGVEIQPQCSI